MRQSSKFKPDWTDQPPPPGSFRSIFKWGAPDGFKHPNARLFALLKKELQLTDRDFAEKELPGNAAAAVETRPAITPEKIAALTAIVGADNVDTGDFARSNFQPERHPKRPFSCAGGLPGMWPTWSCTRATKRMS
jgi:alkyldihydroxyacetonephosphate synthase